MKVRVYDGARGRKERHQYENYPDRYALYFPLPKKEQEDGYKNLGVHITGHYLSFSFSTDGKNITRCCWDEWNLRNGRCDNLGKKVKIETLPEPVQKWIRGYEVVWNNILKDEDNEEYQKAWEDYF